MLVELTAWLAAGYLIVVLVIYLAQTHLIFPRYLASFAPAQLPSSARRLRVTTSDGTQLAGAVFSPTGEARPGEVLLLGFGGNVWDVESMGLSLHRRFPSMHVAGFHYRGYGSSGGRPSAHAVLADALEVFDLLQAQLPSTRTITVGFSIGSPVAAYVARHRPAIGVILVTPFDSLVELARDHFPWLPVQMLIRHRMPTLDFMRDLSVPTAIIAAGRDSVVPRHRTEPLRRAVPNLVFHCVIEDAEHNDLYDRPDFWAAFSEAVRAVCPETDDSSAPLDVGHAVKDRRISDSDSVTTS